MLSSVGLESFCWATSVSHLIALFIKWESERTLWVVDQPIIKTIKLRILFVSNNIIHIDAEGKTSLWFMICVCTRVCAQTSSPGWITSQKLSDTLTLTLTAQTFLKASFLPFIWSMRLLLCLWTGGLLPGVHPKKTPRERLLKIPSICGIIKQIDIQREQFVLLCGLILVGRKPSE